MTPVYAHCRTCRCHEHPTPLPVKPGDVIRNRLTGEVGQVSSVQQPNIPWHRGGTPHVEGSGYWYYYDVVESTDVAKDEH